MDSEQSNEEDTSKTYISKRQEDKLPVLRKEKISFAKNSKNANEEINAQNGVAYETQKRDKFPQKL